MKKTLVKTKIVLEDDGKALVTYFWKKTFLCFGYWYPFGCSSGIKKSDETLNNINDNTVSKVLFDNFIKQNYIPSHNEYQEAKKIIQTYESNQYELEKIKLEEFKTELSIFFKNNNKLNIYEFELRKNLDSYDIIPINPDLEENYEGQLNKEINEISKKYNIKAHIIYWCYHK